MTREGALVELATDGAWTARQLAQRLTAWRCPDIEEYLARGTDRVKPTAWSRTRVRVEIVRLNRRGEELVARLGVRPQVIRAGELEHALGLAELRWRCGVSHDRYLAQDWLGRMHRRVRATGGAGMGDYLPDGVIATERGVVLCEYDHGRYSARQVTQKARSLHRVRVVTGQPVLGEVWGTPTHTRAHWLRSLGVSPVVVMEPDTWMI